MIDFDADSIIIDCLWSPRLETPVEIAARFVALIDRLRELHPTWTRWSTGTKRPLKFETVRDRYAEIVTNGIERDGWREIVPNGGYGLPAMTRDCPDAQTLTIDGHVGERLHSFGLPNQISIDTDDEVHPDPSLFSTEMIVRIISTVIDTWSPLMGRSEPAS